VFDGADVVGSSLSVELGSSSSSVDVDEEDEELVGRYGAPTDSVISCVTVRVSGSGSAVLVTVKVTTTVDGFPSIMVVRVVVTVAADSSFVCVCTWVLVVGLLVVVEDDSGTPVLSQS
jgi:hypothetical protein